MACFIPNVTALKFILSDNSFVISLFYYIFLVYHFHLFKLSVLLSSRHDSF